MIIVIKGIMYFCNSEILYHEHVISFIIKKKLKNKGYAEFSCLALPSVLTLGTQHKICTGASSFPGSLLEM